MSFERVNEVTLILRRWRDGEREAAEQLFPIVYDELRRLARSYISRERSDHTLQPTALVHEAYMRMVDQSLPSVEDRVHFFALSARVMRQVLVDYARAKNAEKRGGAAHRLSIDDIELSGEQTAGDLLQLNDALDRLEQIDERKARVVDMRFFGGLGEAEIADVLGVSEKTVRRDWQFSKLWLYRELSQAGQE